MIIEAVNRKERLRCDGLQSCASVLVEGSQLMLHLYYIIVRHNASIVQAIVNLTIWCDANYFQLDGVVAIQRLYDFVK